MSTAVIIVAAGRGSRMGEGPAKQWRMLGGRSVVARAAEAFARALPGARLVLVLPPDEVGRGAELVTGAEIVAGGAERSASVRAGLEALAGRGVRDVLIHDAARPLVGEALIHRVLAALETVPAAAPGMALADALWRTEGGRILAAAPRTGLARAQTPQGFRYEAILAAHRSHPGGAADDVEVALAAGIEVEMVEGDEGNFKLTVPADFARAEAALAPVPDIRVGNGIDVHRFGEGDRVWLCGVEIPHVQGLVGHSDADVGLHALCDAIYGALADGDIGRHFPPSDPQWKGADSRTFLRHARDLAATRGYMIASVDVTLVCEAPRIAPHGEAMRAAIGTELRIDMGRVSVKATTSEQLGFTGRREGIAAWATATLVRGQKN